MHLREIKMRHVRFELPGPNGSVIRGDVRLSDSDGKRPVVIICHGFKGFKDWGFHPFIGEALAAAGFVAVHINFSHNGVGEDLLEFTELDRLFGETQKTILPEDILRTGQAMGTWMYENHLIIPLFYLFSQVAYDPGIVKGYDVAFGFFGPVRYHEYTEPVYE